MIKEKLVVDVYIIYICFKINESIRLNISFKEIFCLL